MLFFGAQTLVLIIGLTTLLELANYSLAIKQNNRRDKKHKSPPKSIFLNTWAVVVHGDETMAIKVAGENGFINMGKVGAYLYLVLICTYLPIYISRILKLFLPITC